MTETRMYSVDEIDIMRSALRTIVTPIGVGYYPAEIDNRVELQLRTHMMNGTEPSDLQQKAATAHQDRPPRFILGNQTKALGEDNG